MTKRRRPDEESERDVKWCLTEMRNKDGGGWGVIDSARSQTNFHSQPHPDQLMIKNSAGVTLLHIRGTSGFMTR